MISIVIPTYNHFYDCLKPCIESILKHTNISDIEIVVVANGCTDETKAYIERLGHPFRLVWMDDAVGFIKATNAGIRVANGDFILLLNNDTVLLEQEKNAWINMLMAPFSNPKVGITGSFKDVRIFWESGKTIFREQYMVFYCAMIRHSVFDSIGLLDETFGLGYEEDIDFCIRAQRAGYQMVQVPDDIQYDLNLGKDELAETPNRNPRFPMFHKDRMTFGDPSINRPPSILLKKYASPPPKYSIIIPTYNHLEDCLKPCIESVIQNTEMSNVEVIIVANGCTDGTKEYVRNLGEPFRLYWADEPLGYTKATNLGIHHARGRYVVLLNNDSVILGKNWLEMLEAPFAADSLVGITGAAKNFHSETNSEFLLFFCVMISWYMIEKIGKLDEAFNPGYGEDIDYCNKIRRSGYKVVQVPNDVTLTKIRREDEHSLLFPIWHKGSVTVSRFEGWEHVVPRNEKILAERYNVTDRKLIKVNLDPSINMGPEYAVPQNPISLSYEPGSVEEIHAHRILDLFDGNMINWIIDGWTKVLTEEGRLHARINNRTNLTLVKPGFCNGLFKGSSWLRSVIVDNRISERSIDSIKNFVFAAGSKEVKIFGGNFNGGYCMQQNPDEISRFIFDHKDIKVENYLEIGVADHGLMRLICDFLDVNNLYSLDLGWQDQNFPNTLRENLDNLKNRGCYELFRGDSHSAAADKWLSQTGKEFDFILIDGDHSYDGVKKDTMLAMKYAKPGCIFAFHDHACVDDIQGFCDEMRSGQIAGMSLVSEYVSQDPTRKGILVFRFDPNAPANKIDKASWEYNRRFTRNDNGISGDIFEHMPTLKKYASLCDHVTEFGVRWGSSTWALFAGKPKKMRTYDKFDCPVAKEIQDEAPSHNVDFTFQVADCLQIEIEETDLLFIDTKHAYEQLISELIMHSPKVKKYIIMHDTVSFAHRSQDGEDWESNFRPNYLKGLVDAIDDFLAKNDKWKRKEVFENNNGLTVLERVKDEVAAKKNKIYDCFTFYNEFDLLEMRLNEMNDIVDKFVIVEATLTFTGKPKPLYFNKNKQQFQKFLHKIEHIIVDDFPETENQWLREHYQRNAIMQGLKGCSDDDIILISDADEIPRAEAIKQYKPEMGIINLGMGFFYYLLNCKGPYEWVEPKILPYGMLKESTPELIRHIHGSGTTPVLHDAGWHFSYLGDVDSIIKKIESFSHTEFNKPEFKDRNHVLDCIANGKDVFKRFDFHFVDIDETYPDYVKKNLMYFAKKGFIKPRPQTSLPDGWFESEDQASYMKLINSLSKNGKMTEVGVWQGKSLCSVAKAIRDNNITVCAVDTFKGAPSEPGVQETAKLIDIREIFERNIINFELHNNIIVCCSDSPEFAKDMQDDSLDLVFIDADHLYEPAKADILAWLPKVKNGGIIAGHDFHNAPGVKKAVVEIFGSNIAVEGNVWHAIKGVPPGRSSTPKYSIVIPTYNHLEDCLKPCLQSILKYTDLLNVEVIVVANGCTDGTKEYVESLGYPFKLIWMDSAAGYIKPINAGIKESRGEYVILLNNDTNLTYSAANGAWLKMLEQPFLNDPKMGIVGPRKAWNNVVNAEYMIFFCVMIKREVFDRIGILDESFEDGYHEDIDFSIRASKAGFKMIEVPDDITYNGETYDQDYNKNEARPANFPIIHYGGATFSHIYGTSQAHLTKNRDRLIQKHCPERQRIFDCFMFFNELDVLEIRFNELFEVVDKFILVEAAVTHQGGPKPLYFNENKERFNKFMHKIEHVIVNDMPTTNDTWVREPFQRNCAMRGLLKHNPRPDDIVILSDVDEIPRASTVRQYKKEMGLTCIKTRLYYYKLNYQAPIEWFKLRIFPFSEINGGDLQQFRGSRDYDYRSIMEDGGWHFSFIGNKDHIKEKIEGWAHVEFNNDSIKNDSNISEALNRGRDILGRGIQFERVDINESFPKFVRDNIKSYEENGFIAKVDKAVDRPKIYDCFSFFNELEMLEIRLNELDPYVDYFVISEMAVTHSGKPKPLYFNENKQRFAKFLHKIIHLVVTDCFEGNVDPWQREHYQRNYLINGLHKCNDNDIVIISDLDEIPRGTKIKEYVGQRDWMYFEQHQYNYYLNMSVGISKVGPGAYSRITTYGNMKRLGLKPTDLRYKDCDFNFDRIADGGWHFSWMGGGDKIVDKLEAWAHQELNIPAYKNTKEIERNIEKEIDAFGRPDAPHTPKLVPLDPTFPEYILKNQSLFVEQKLIKPFSEKKRVGIVMPYYNDRDLLIRSAFAILNQTHKDWILFVIDDGSSSDNSAKKALEGLDPDRIKVIEKENGGVSSARNKALEMIRLDSSINYVAYCDADDMWDGNYLSSQLEHLGDCDLVYSEVRHEFDNGTKAFPFGIPNPEGYPGLDFMISNAFIFISSVVHRVRCLSVGHFDVRLDSIEDWDMWIRIAKAGYKIKKNKDAYITYVVKTASNMASKRTDQKYAMFREKHPLVKNEMATLV